MRKVAFIIVLFTIAFSKITTAQDELFFSKLNKDMGLSYSTVRDICQDSKGNIWLATELGLNKYDGFNVINYFADGKSGLKENEINCIMQCENGIIIGAADGLYRYDHDTEIISPLLCMGEQLGYISSICLANGDVYISSNKGIFRAHDWNVFRINDMKNILSMCADRASGIWAATEGKLMKLSSDGQILSTTEMPGILVSKIYIDDHSTVLVGTKLSGVYQYDQVKRTLTPIETNNYKNEEMVFVRALCSDMKGNLWIGTENGLFIYNIATHECKNYKKNYLTPSKGISSNPVYSIFRSDDEVMWVGTFFDGVDYTDISSKRMRFIIPDDGNTSIKGHAIRSFMEDKDGNIWFATEDGGISIYDTDKHSYRHINKRTVPGLKGDNVHTMVQDRCGNVWAANYLDGVHKISADLKHIENYPAPKSDPRIIIESCADSLMIGYANGLYSICVHNAEFKEFMPEFFKDKYINYLLKDHNGDVWICAGNKKLYRYQIEKGEQIIEYDFPYNVISGTVTDNGDLWFCTFDSKIVRFRVGDIKVVNLDLDDKVNAIVSIVSDGLDHLWMGTFNGIISYNTANGDIHRYAVSEGLISNQFSGTGAMKTSRGEIYLASIKGACSFTAEIMDEHSISNEIPELVLSDFKVLNSNYEYLSESIDIVKEVKLKHKHNAISFNITPVLIKADIKPVHIMEYMLEGVDNDFNRIEAKPITAIYRNIPSGEHWFHVRFLNPSGTIRAERSLKIIIKPPFMASTTMMSAYLVVILLIILAALNTIRKRNLRNMESVLSDQRARMFTYLAHEIKNPLSVVSAVMEDGRDLNSKERNIINRNLSRMQFLIKQLMDYRAIESKKFKVNYTNGDLVQFLRACYDTFQPLLEHNDQHGTFVSSHDAIECSFDNDIIEKIYCNLLSNAVKHSEKGGDIRSEVSLTEDGKVSISVFNSGSYIPEEQISQIIQPFFKAKGKDNSGIGMALVNDFTKMLKGSLDISSSQNIGTRFTVTLPIIQDEPEAESDNEYKLSNEILNNTYYELSSNMTVQNTQSIDNGRYTILVADDNTDFNNLISDKLREKYNILQAYDGREALSMIDKTIDLVISDINMPEANGYKICARIKGDNKLAHIPVILMTSDHTEARRLEGLNYGADGYMEKPVSLQELRMKVKNLLESKEKVKQYYQDKVKFETIEKLSNKEEQFIADLTQFVRENISDQELNVSTLATYAKISRTQIYNRLKTTINMSAAEFINKIRMDMAVEKLSQTDKSVSEISWELGFSSPSYFVKTFKKQFETTPKEFRNVNGHELQNDQ